jgi:glycosyltransferase involved in cell wall biosynthesis
MATDPHDVDATIDVVVPAHDEVRIIEATIRAVHHHLSVHRRGPWQLTIAENASTDGTAEIADRLTAELPQVRTLHLPVAGRGAALRAAWTTSTADVLVYMDADLSTDLGALFPLIDAVTSGGADLAIGSRLVPGADVERRLPREGISRAYNAIVRTVLGARFHDAQCGFKAIRRNAAATLVPLVHDEGWFFDTELLLLAQRNGLRIDEIPVRWVDDPDSSVRIIPTAVADLRGVARMARSGRAAT